MIQGIGELVMPVLTTLLVQAAGGRPLGKLMATVSLPAVLVPILGPVAGGLILSNLSWRWIFYVNVPICLVALVLAWCGMSPSRGTAAAPRLDVAGLALLSPAVALMLYGLAQVSDDGGFAHRGVLIPLAAGAMLLASFIAWTLTAPPGHAGYRPAAAPGAVLRGGRADVHLGPVDVRRAVPAAALLPADPRASALGAGLLLAPQGIGALLPRTLAGTLTDRIGPRPVVLAGMAVAAAGTVPFALAGAHTSELLLSLVLVVRGAGLTTANIALMAGAFTGLPRESVPDASSVTRIMQQVGGSFGTAVLAVILVGTVPSRRRSGGRWRSPPWRCCLRLCCLTAQRPGSRAAPARGRSASRVTVSRRGDGTATGQLASAQTVRPGRPHGNPSGWCRRRPWRGPAALGHQVEPTGRRNGRAAVVGDGDAGYPSPRAVDLDREHTAAPRGGVRDRVGAELGHAGHQRLAGRAPGQQLTDEPACFRYGRGRAPVGTGPRYASSGTGPKCSTG